MARPKATKRLDDISVYTMDPATLLFPTKSIREAESLQKLLATVAIEALQSAYIRTVAEINQPLIMDQKLLQTAGIGICGCKRPFKLVESSSGKCPICLKNI